MTVRFGRLRDRAQKCRGRTGAPVPADAELIGADAERRLAVEIGIARQAELARRPRPRPAMPDCRCADRRPRTRRGRRDTGSRRRDSVRSGGNTAGVRDSSSRSAPSRSQSSKSSCWPRMKISPLIDDEPPSTRPRGQTMARPPLPSRGLGLEQAREAFVVDGPVIADRKLQPEIPIRAAGLQQQHAAGGSADKPVGDHAAGRTRADDDVVIAAVLPSRSVRYCSIDARSGSMPRPGLVAERRSCRR